MADVFHSLWVGTSLSKMEQLSIKSFIDHGNIYHLYCYHEVEDLPEGALVKDANEIVPEKDIFTYTNGSFSAFSNYFRFQLLYQRGGCWVDTDFICLKKLDLAQPYVFASEVGPTYQEQATSFFLKLPRHSKVAQRGIEIQEEHRERIVSGEMEWGSGPLTVRQLIKEFELEHNVMSWDHFITCWCQDAPSLVDPHFVSRLPAIKQIERLPKKMLGIHLWNEIWRRNNLDKNMSYHPESIYERLKAIHQLHKGLNTMRAMDIRSRLHKEDPYQGFPYTDYPLDLSGWGSEDPNFELIIQQVRPKLIVEVGTWKGSSAITMARTMRKHGIAGHILCVDTWLGGLEAWARQDNPKYYAALKLKNGYPSLYYQFLANVMHTGFDQYITPFPQTSQIAARWLRQQNIRADLIYIDASHDEEDVYLDLVAYWEVLNPRGTLFGDDFDHWPSVRRAVGRFGRDYGVHVEARGRQWVIAKRSEA